MIARRMTIVLVLAMVAWAVPVYADMSPILLADTPLPGLETVCTRACAGEEIDILSSCLGPVAVGFPSVGQRPEAESAAGSSGVPRPVTVLTDRRGSVTFCLYALMGLGLCKSAPWMRKFTFGTIPEWYHDGGPFQIGHSLALSPDCFCAAAVCFLQPKVPSQDLLPQYCTSTVVCLWRDSQCAPAVLAARGPPRLS